ncbi:aldose epimerase family protein [Marivivens marinus]|uniref:aldose epimerase family protein n=1 Tax=Marivivens marinus TaxID=3110173 RepID=UPI003B84A7AD
MTLFGHLSDGRAVHEVTLDAHGMQARILTYGAILRDLRPAGFGHSVTLGSDRLRDYETIMDYYGAVIAPVGNRIGGAKARIGGMEHRFEANENGQTTLHSGASGSHRKVWDIVDQSASRVTLQVLLPDGDGGFPGNQILTVRYDLDTKGALALDITATTDEPGLMNVAHHGYWNLDGTDSWDGHRLRIAADHYLPIDDLTLPTGEVADVTGTSFDLRDGPVLQRGAPAIDHNFCTADTDLPIRNVLWLTGANGRQMTLSTTAPGLQVFDGRNTDDQGFAAYAGLAIEPQHWPDAPNNRQFPKITLNPGQTYRQTSQFHFSA